MTTNNSSLPPFSLQGHLGSVPASSRRGRSTVGRLGAVDNPAPPAGPPRPAWKANDNDRVRREVGFRNSQRRLGKGAATHRVLHRLAGEDRAWGITEIEQACREELAQRPLKAPKHLATPLNEITTHVTNGLAMLPPLEWKLLAVEVPGVAGSEEARRAVDQTWQAPEPIIVRESIGVIVQFELKQGGVFNVAELASTENQRRAHLRAGRALWGEDLLGQVTLSLGHPSRSTLHLADDPDTAIRLDESDLWWFPTGRVAD